MLSTALLTQQLWNVYDDNWVYLFPFLWIPSFHSAAVCFNNNNNDITLFNPGSTSIATLSLFSIGVGVDIIIVPHIQKEFN